MISTHRLASTRAVGVLALLGLLAFGALAADYGSTRVSPADRELNLQEKMRLQEKINEELEQHRRKVEQEKAAQAQQPTDETPPVPDEINESP